VDLNERMGIAITEASPKRVVATMPVEGNTQPFGLLHGGASCVLAESVGSLGATLWGLEIGRPRAVGIEINATHHKGVTEGEVTAVATPLRLGASLASFEIVITDAAGDRVCTARLSCLLKK